MNEHLDTDRAENQMDSARPLADAETGQLPGGFPVVRVGDGAARLVVIPGLNDAPQPATAMPRFWARFCHSLGGGRTVHVVSRPRGLPSGMTTRDMAADLAGVLEEYIGPADVMGLSMGGFIAQHLAVDAPRQVRRLVLAICGARMDDDNREVSEQWLAWARAGRMDDAYTAMVERMYAGSPAAGAPGRVRFSPKSALRSVVDPADFIVSLEACMAHDTRERAMEIHQPTLVIGGDEDRMTPPALCRDLARRIAGSKLELIADGGHGLFEERWEEAGEAVAGFLDGGAESMTLPG
jgi:pimeloyl-ACP methyl ester carboxylesterase